MPVAATLHADPTGGGHAVTPLAEAYPGKASSPRSVEVNAKASRGPLLATQRDLPRASHALVRSLLLLTQAMYLAFYLGALANLPEIRRIFLDAQLLSPAVLMILLVTSAVMLIPVRLFIVTAVAFDYPQLPAKFSKLFPVLLPLDLLWALSPFLLVHHVSMGLALGMTAALVYMPFAQRSLVLMFGRGWEIPQPAS